MARMREGTTTDDYRNALSGEGEFMSLGYEWSDKPHRLVYDLCGEVDHLRAALRGLVDAVKAGEAVSGAEAMGRAEDALKTT